MLFGYGILLLVGGLCLLLGWAIGYVGKGALINNEKLAALEHQFAWRGREIERLLAEEQRLRARIREHEMTDLRHDGKVVRPAAPRESMAFSVPRPKPETFGGKAATAVSRTTDDTIAVNKSSDDGMSMLMTGIVIANAMNDGSSAKAAVCAPTPSYDPAPTSSYDSGSSSSGGGDSGGGGGGGD